MPSIAIQSAFIAITAATNKGLLTVGAGQTAYLFPGAYAWLCKDDGSANARVKILAVDATNNTVTVRIMPTRQDPFSTTYVQSETNPPPSYGLSDVSAFNGSSHICQEAQTAPIDPTYAKRVVP